MLRMHHIRTPLLLIGASACLALTGCGGGEKTAGNTVEMRDMEVADGTVNDSMTDLDAVRANGVGTVSNAGSVSRAQSDAPAANKTDEDTETVASE